MWGVAKAAEARLLGRRGGSMKWLKRQHDHLIIPIFILYPHI